MVSCNVFCLQVSYHLLDFGEREREKSRTLSICKSIHVFVNTSSMLCARRQVTRTQEHSSKCRSERLKLPVLLRLRIGL